MPFDPTRLRAPSKLMSARHLSTVLARSATPMPASFRAIVAARAANLWAAARAENAALRSGVFSESVSQRASGLRAALRAEAAADAASARSLRGECSDLLVDGYRRGA